jgi:Ca-activated chloride channel homolog
MLHVIGVSALTLALVVAAVVAYGPLSRLMGCPEPEYLRVASALSIAPVLQEAAGQYNDETDGCHYVQVSEMPPHLAMTELSGGRTAGDSLTPDVWVPESSAWVELARISEAGAQALEPNPRSLASSPVVLAAPEGAEGVGDGEHAESWERILPGERDPERPVLIVDPNRGAEGMAAMHAVRRKLGTGDEADAAMTEFVRAVQSDSAFGHIELTGVYPGTEPRAVVPEQSVWSYNATNPQVPLRAFYPEESTVSLDYPFAAATEDPELLEAASGLYDLLTSSDYRRRLEELGFRDPGGDGSRVLTDMPGVDSARPGVHEEMTGQALLSSVEDWNRLSMPTRALVLADVSAASAEDLDGGPPRVEVAAEAAELGLSLFPNETDLGLWLLSTELDSSGHHQEQGLARLDDDHDEGSVREHLQQVAVSIEAEGGQNRLYDSVAAAYAEMSESYHEDKINSLIVLASGDDEGSELDHGELIAQLEDSFDPERPVTMFLIAFGHFDDTGSLTEVANATSGTAYFTEDPAEIAEIFLSSISRRLCVPDCEDQ